MANLPTLSEVQYPKRAGYEAALGDLLVRLARAPDRPLSIMSADKEVERIQTEQTSEDFLPEIGRVYSRNNFTGGAGLDFAYKAENTALDRTRYWDSKGIDIAIAPPGELEAVSLLVDTESLWTSTASNLYMAVLANGTLLYAETSSVYSIASPGGASPSRSSEDPHTGTQSVEGLATLGDEAFAACGTDGIGKRSSGGTWSNMASATNCFGIWGVKSRLIADSGAGIIQTIDTSTGAPTTLITMDSGDGVTDVVDAGSSILIATSNGTVYSLTDEAGTLTLQSQTRVTSVDVVTCMAFAAGVVILGTTEGSIGRIWQAGIGTADNAYTITNLQMLRELGYSPTAAVATRDRIYVAARDSSTETVLWRYQLATSSISRDLVFDASTAGDPVDVVRVGAKLYCTVAANDVFREDTALISQGWLITAMADFYSPSEKAWIGLKVQADNLTANSDLELLVSNDPDGLLDKDHVSWLYIGRLSSTDQVSEELNMSNIYGRYAAVQLRLNSGDLATSPRVTSVALRSYDDSDDLVVRLPVNVSDWIERRHRRPHRVNGWGRRIFNALLGMDGTDITLQLYRPDLTIQGVVSSVQFPVISNSDRGSTTTYSLVEVRGKWIPAGTAAAGSGSGTLGVGLAGVALAGVDN